MRYQKFDVLRQEDAGRLQRKLSNLEAEAQRRSHPGRKLQHAIVLCRAALKGALRTEQIEQAKPKNPDHTEANEKHGKRVGACLFKGEEIFVFTVHHPDPRLQREVKCKGVNGWKHTYPNDKIFKSRRVAMEACENFLRYFRIKNEPINMSDVSFDMAREVV